MQVDPLGGPDHTGRPTNASPDMPAWAPPWAPSTVSLDYVQKLAAVTFLALGVAYFLGLRPLRPFARAHVASV